MNISKHYLTGFCGGTAPSLLKPSIVLHIQFATIDYVPPLIFVIPLVPIIARFSSVIQHSCLPIIAQKLPDWCVHT